MNHLLAIMAAVAAPATSEAAEVREFAEMFTELGQQLARGGYDTVSRKDGLPECVVTRSSGDAQLDQVVCLAMQECYSQIGNDFNLAAGATCMNRETNTQLALLAIRRIGLSFERLDGEND